MTLPAFLRTSLPALAFALALATPSVAEAALKVDGKPTVTFFAVGSPGFLDIEGVTNTLSASDDGTRLVLSVPMTTVKSGIALRDEHMNEKYVETGKFPNVTIGLAKADVKWPVNVGEAHEGVVKAVFNAHGVDVPVDVSYRVSKTKTGFRVKAQFPFDTAAHGIAIPSYLGVTVDPKMRAEATVDLIDAP